MTKRSHRRKLRNYTGNFFSSCFLTFISEFASFVQSSLCVYYSLLLHMYTLFLIINYSRFHKKNLPCRLASPDDIIGQIMVPRLYEAHPVI